MSVMWLSPSLAVAAPEPDLIFEIVAEDPELAVTGDMAVFFKRKKILSEIEVTSSNLETGQKVDIWVNRVSVR